MTANLPPGWSARKKDTLTPYILILALVLAIFISVLIFGCVAWRRKRRSAAKDLEKKLHERSILDSDSELDVDANEKLRARVQHRRLWVKTSPRWRPNVKLSARRRRKKALVTATNNESLPDVSGGPEASIAEASLSTESFPPDPLPVTADTASASFSLKSTSSNYDMPRAETPLGEWAAVCSR